MKQDVVIVGAFVGPLALVLGQGAVELAVEEAAVEDGRGQLGVAFSGVGGGCVAVMIGDVALTEGD